MLSLAGLLSLLACGGGSSSSLTATPSEVAFGDVAVSTSATQDVTLTNPTGAPVTIVDVIATGAGIAASGPALPISLAAGQSTTLAVRFAPATSGTAGGTVSVLSDTQTEPVAVVTYDGRAVLPSSPIAVTPPAVDFAEVSLGASTSRSVTLTNESSHTVSLTSLSQSSTAVSTSGLTLPISLAPGGSKTFSLVFRPGAAGTEAGYLALNAEPARPLAVVEFRGTGITRPMSLTAAPAQLDFQEVAVGSFSARSVTLTNASAEPVTISQLIATGAGMSASGLALPATVAPGASVAVGVRFTPTAAGAVSGSVSIMAAGQEEPLAVVACAGSGVAAPSITSVTVRDASIEASKTVQLVADVVATGATDTSVTWSVESGSLGTVGAQSGVYTAPSTPGTYRVAATSNADSSKKGIGTVTVLAPPPAPEVVAVTVAPATASLSAGDARTFAATVTGTTNTAVTWSVQEGAAGGSITSAGAYTAPANAGTYHVVARSQADTTKSAAATATVTAPAPAPVVAVSLSPTTASLTTGGTQAFAATVTGTTNTAVTWSVQEGAAGGSITSAGVYTAPTTAGTYHVTATSFADTSKTATAVVTAAASSAPPPGAVAAFPGGEGAGALAKGGRGGAVYLVTNLNDSGTGSLRACVEASGPRTCVFRVAGTIVLTSGLNVRNPFLTVAGQTSPGGIQLRAATTNSLVSVYTHDVVWRYTRIRHGMVANSQSDSFRLMQGAYNVVLDHNTFGWPTDEALGIYMTTGPAARDVSVTWNIFHEPFAAHPVNVQSGAASRELADAMTDIDFARNIFLHGNHRNPLARHKSGRFVNNIFYNWSYYATRIEGGATYDWIGNKYKAGPMTPSSVREIEVKPGGSVESANGPPSLYMKGNIGPHNSSSSTDGWSAMVWDVTLSATLSSTYRRSSPRSSFTGTTITVLDASQLDASLLGTIGASQRLDCSGAWVNARDSVDSRLITQYLTGTGPSTTPVNENDPIIGGFPTINAVAACADSDSDGMPDAWETSQGLNPKDANDRNGYAAGSGYTNLERYLAGR